MHTFNVFNKETSEWEAIPAIRGEKGVSIETATVNDSGNLVIGLTDNTELDAGHVVGDKGADGKSAYVTTVTATLSASGWKENAYSDLPEQDVSVEGLTSDDEGDIGLNSANISAERVAAAASAMLLATEQGDGYITVTAFGTTPTIDIPIIVRVVRVG